jgi:hypothetical protein
MGRRAQGKGNRGQLIKAQLRLSYWRPEVAVGPNHIYENYSYWSYHSAESGVEDVTEAELQALIRTVEKWRAGR